MGAKKEGKREEGRKEKEGREKKGMRMGRKIGYEEGEAYMNGVR